MSSVDYQSKDPNTAIVPGSGSYLEVEDVSNEPSTHITRLDEPTDTMATTRSHANRDDGDLMMEFPKGLARPHHARDWWSALESHAAKQELTDVLHHRLPSGKFDKLHSPEACEDGPPLPDGASYKGQLSFLARRDKVEERNITEKDTDYAGWRSML